MINEKENDFGFTFVDETEYEEYEKTLKDQLTTHSIAASQAQRKLDKVMATIRPFLAELGADPAKLYIKWHRRGEQIKAFQNKLDAIINGE